MSDDATVEAQVRARRKLHRLALEASRFGRKPVEWVKAVCAIYPVEVSLIGAKQLACIAALAWRSQMNGTGR